MNQQNKIDMSDYTKEQIAAKREAIAKEILMNIVRNGAYGPRATVEEIEFTADSAIALADEFLKQLSEK